MGSHSPAMRMGSHLMKTLVSLMMTRHFINRPTVNITMKDPWFAVDSTDDTGLTDEFDDLLSDARTRSKTGQDENHFKKAFVQDFVAGQNLAQLSKWNDLFIKLDEGDTGSISEVQFRSAMADSMEEADLELLIENLGIN